MQDITLPAIIVIAISSIVTTWVFLPHLLAVAGIGGWYRYADQQAKSKEVKCIGPYKTRKRANTEFMFDNYFRILKVKYHLVKPKGALPIEEQ